MRLMISGNLGDDFCELFNYSIRSIIISKLLSNTELRISELEINNINRSEHNSIAHRNTVNNHLTELRKRGYVKYRRDGLEIYWSLDRDNEIIGKLKLLFSEKDNTQKKKRSRNTDSEIKKYLFEYYAEFEKFKPVDFRKRLELESYSISSARLSQVLKSLVDQDILKKEEKARYKIINKPRYDNYN